MPYFGRLMANSTSGKPDAAPTDRLTPAMRQYTEQKAAAPDALLLFRMGDFYETFFEDAKTAARVLGITLTSRGAGPDGEPIPLAGIPYHALNGYLTKLVHAGLKVAISEQVEDPKQAKTVVRREIVRIVTPGTLTEDALLEGGADNYLAALCHAGADRVGLALVELSTGAFWVQVLDGEELIDELVRLAPAELLCPEVPLGASDPLARLVEALSGPGGRISGLAVTRRPPRAFATHTARECLHELFRVVSLEGFGFAEMDASLCAAAAVVDYLRETQKAALAHLVSLRRRESRHYVRIDEATWRSLEVERTLRAAGTAGSLLEAVNRTSTTMGARCLRRWLSAPLRDPAAISERHAAVDELLSDVHQLEAIRRELRELADIERITARVGLGRASPRDLVGLGASLLRGERVAELLDELARRKVAQMLAVRTEGERDAHPAAGAARAGASPSDDASGCGPASGDLAVFLTVRRDGLCGLHDLAEFLTKALDVQAPLALNEGGIIAPGYDAELDRLRDFNRSNSQWLVDYQNREIQRTGIGSLKVGFNEVFGYYIEITNTHRDKAPADYVRKQTLKNAERYITDELKKHEHQALNAREQSIRREAELFEAIRRKVIEYVPALQRLASAAAELDVVAGFAHLADRRRYVRPQLVAEPLLEITDGRHPVLEQNLDGKFVPNDCHIAGPTAEPTDGTPAPKIRPADWPPSLIVLTGPNMAGKSTYIRQVALLTLLAQAGSFVPAKAMRLGPVDRIFARVGAADEISRGQSTFMVEMTEAANILHNATPVSLVIIDELGRGTSTFDGLSLAWAIAEELVRRVGCRTLFATHYHELTSLSEQASGVANANVAVREWQDEIVFLHRIVPGAADKSYGTHVARLAGVPAGVVQRAQELLNQLETGVAPGYASAVKARLSGQRQLYLFGDPLEQLAAEVRAADPAAMSAEQLRAMLAQWKKGLG